MNTKNQTKSPITNLPFATGTPAVGFLVLLLFLTMGCQDQITIETIHFSGGSPVDFNADDGEDIYAVLDMCDLVRRGDSMMIVQLTDYEADQSPCEDWQYRTLHGDATFEILDHIVGQTYDSPLEAVDWGRSGGFGDTKHVGDYFVLNVSEINGELFIRRSTKIYLNNDISHANDDSTPPNTGYDLPTDYGEFTNLATSYWENFEDNCDGVRNYTTRTDEELIEYYFGEPECPGISDQNQNQNDTDNAAQGTNMYESD